MLNIFLSTVNEGTITIMLIIIINVKKFPGNTFFVGFQLQFSKTNVLLRKKPVVHTTTLMHCKARQVFYELFSTNQGNGLDMTFVARATKINFKNLENLKASII